MLSCDAREKMTILFDAIVDVLSMDEEDFHQAFGAKFINASDLEERIHFIKDRYHPKIRPERGWEGFLGDLNHFYNSILPARGSVLKNKEEDYHIGVLWADIDRMGAIILDGPMKDSYIEYPLHNGRLSQSSKMELATNKKFQVSVETDWSSLF